MPDTNSERSCSLLRLANHASKLEHGGNKLKNNSSEEWPERTEQSGVIQLQQCHCSPESREQIKDEVGKRAL
jgi:hypothetical protein